MFNHFKCVTCCICSDQVNVADHLNLPHCRQPAYTKGKQDEWQTREEATKKTMRGHCIAMHPDDTMMWEVAQRDDSYSSIKGLCRKSSFGRTWFFVRTFLLSSTFLLFLRSQRRTACAVSCVCIDCLEKSHRHNGMFTKPTNLLSVMLSTMHSHTKPNSFSYRQERKSSHLFYGKKRLVEKTKRGTRERERKKVLGRVDQCRRTPS